MGLLELSKRAEFAPGIPERRRLPMREVRRPETWEMSAHPHAAERAKRHIDLRLADPQTGHAHSFVVPKAEWPAPGKAVLIQPTFTHTADYLGFTGTIEKGYGKGTVEKGRQTQADVYHVDPDESQAGTKVRFNLYDEDHPQEYSIRRDKEGRWFLHNKTLTRERRPDLPDFKPEYREQHIDEVDPADSSQAMMAKLDGAHAVIDLQAGRAPRVFSYRRGKTSSTELIEHTHKFPALLKMKVPNELDGTLLRAELIGLKDGRAIPGEQLGGLLNSKVWESRRKQQELGVELEARPFSVVRHRWRKEPMEGASFSRQLEVLKAVESKLPGLRMPPLATTTDDKRRLLNEVKAGGHPLTAEGVVLVSRDEPAKMIKVKLTPDFDVHVQAVHPAVSSSGKELDRAGAVSYSWTGNGPIIGRLGGFAHDEARKMLAEPERYVGRVAKVRAAKVFKQQDGQPGPLFQPRFAGWHLDKGEAEKVALLGGLANELGKLAARAGVRAIGRLLGVGDAPALRPWPGRPA